MLAARLGDPLRVRWIVLRGLGLIHLSVFWSLAGQIHGLIGPRGLLPVAESARARCASTPTFVARSWMAPSLLWLSASNAALTALVVVGVLASLRARLSTSGRGSRSRVASSRSSRSSPWRRTSRRLPIRRHADGGVVPRLFYAPRGLRPGLGAASPPSRAALWLLRWEWFRIYFVSGVVKLVSGETQWRDLTAMVEVLRERPAADVDRLVRAAAAAARVSRRRGLRPRWSSSWCCRSGRVPAAALARARVRALQRLSARHHRHRQLRVSELPRVAARRDDLLRARRPAEDAGVARAARAGLASAPTSRSCLLGFFAHGAAAAQLLSPFRLAENYGLFAVMTRARYEIEFQGTRDGKTLDRLSVPL